MADLTLSEDDHAALRSILLAERSQGVDRPLLPLDVDIDGDGICDAWGLNENDDVVRVPGVALEGTLYLSEGDDVAEEG